MTSGWPRCIWAETVSADGWPSSWPGEVGAGLHSASLRQLRVNARLVHRLAPDAPRTRLALSCPAFSGHLIIGSQAASRVL